jgi:hypothetical protein
MCLRWGAMRIPSSSGADAQLSCYDLGLLHAGSD